MSATDTASASAPVDNQLGAVRAGLKRRHAQERRFQMIGLAAVFAALAMVAVLFGSVLFKGMPAFWQSTLHLQISLNADVIDVGPPPVQKAGQNPAEFEAELTDWRRALARVSWNKILEKAVRGVLPADLADAKTRDIVGIVASGERYALRDMVLEDPSLIGQTIDVDLLADANVDNWLKGNIDRSLGQSRQQLSPGEQEIADALAEKGVITQSFNTGIFFNVDSRSSPASAGLAGAFMGSLYMMLVVIMLAVPIGVASAIYLEEFAPTNRFTDFIEVNINNLAAVPSIVFGLLGASIFINWMHLPLSAPLVGGLVLTLMTLPTIIIATRGTLRAIPPSIREAALGLGASRTQMVFHHVLPLAIPGILTATIIGVAQALGETAPLLLIGMNAFVASVPSSPMDQATALPVQIYLWQGNENFNFFEARTNAAIIVLLGLMISLNAIAILLRQRIERRW
ncbi:phosphate ABC transporter permease PstA [Afifella marina]|uniref:Phosphate transport system permease protein PstA n=1 Tax=Afifella marina DSM 2698 TaxID=1120955 RepID=A0A1G5M4N3_AFIMA|nr:phosphate ABC transporter permease PstA [Afifella marina]MBK1622976.1 phosphate ABC transporter, permease protein PstA [Afifella marina DSM 2698]MBK1625970.1 phosphate ABC transporter, permease protein PstA [Afifella marina]MBK5917794.1 phosphate ABC transporter, permease protein PstA [Afifella marina]RAI23698.1 phosphate ABC transporter, permease protein PstA [Afifella marina DSM 2698]SCZ20157.1 phosphate transport system permease protein [Afifella marina DSM 2698]